MKIRPRLKRISRKIPMACRKCIVRFIKKMSKLLPLTSTTLSISRLRFGERLMKLWIKSFSKLPNFEVKCDLYNYYHFTLILKVLMILQKHYSHSFLTKLYVLYLRNSVRKFDSLVTLIDSGLKGNTKETLAVGESV